MVKAVGKHWYMFHNSHILSNSFIMFFMFMQSACGNFPSNAFCNNFYRGTFFAKKNNLSNGSIWHFIQIGVWSWVFWPPWPAKRMGLDFALHALGKIEEIVLRDSYGQGVSLVKGPSQRRETSSENWFLPHFCHFSSKYYKKIQKYSKPWTLLLIYNIIVKI